MKDKIVVITGGSRGIGRGLVYKFAEAGAKVIFTYLSNEEKACEVIETANKKYGILVDTKQVDGRCEREVKKFLDYISEKYGHIDVLINNAGYITRRNVEDMTDDIWLNSIDTNFNAVMYFCKNSLKLMKHGNSSIVNISTVCAEQPLKGQAAYSTTKSAVETLSKVLALEYAKYKIRVNVVSPGFIMTEKKKMMSEQDIQNVIESIPLKRAGNSDDIANVVMFLASDDSSYITGANIPISGGNHLRC